MATFGNKNSSMSCDPLTLCHPSGASIDTCMSVENSKGVDTLLLQNINRMYANQKITDTTKKKVLGTISKKEKRTICECLDVLTEKEAPDLRDSICGSLITNTINTAAVNFK